MYVCNQKRFRNRGQLTVRVMIAGLSAIMLFFCFSGLALAASEGGSPGWLETDWYRLMNFTVLITALFFLLKKPVSQALNNRIQGIKEQLAELEAGKKEAEEKLAEYNEKFNQLDKETEKLVAEYVKQGQDAKARIIKEAEASADKLEAQAKKNIENEFKKAREQLQVEVLDRALTKAEDLIKGKITSEDQDRLVNEYLEKVVV